MANKYSIPEDKREIPTPIMASRFPHLEAIANKIPPYDQDANVSLLIGRDAPECLKVRTFINGPKGAPWAQKLSLGWTICGQVCLERLGGAVHVSMNKTTVMRPEEHQSSSQTNHPVTADEGLIRCTFTPCPSNFLVKDIYTERRIIDDVYHTSPKDNEVAYSIEDRRFTDIMEQGIHKNELGNWELPLPFGSSGVRLPRTNREERLPRERLIENMRSNVLTTCVVHLYEGRR